MSRFQQEFDDPREAPSSFAEGMAEEAPHPGDLFSGTEELDLKNQSKAKWRTLHGKQHVKRGRTSRSP